VAQTFYPITPTEITAGAASEWTSMDAGALAPAGTTGLILHCVNTSISPREISLRKNGSTDDRHGDMRPSVHFWAMIGVDASRIFEAYVESTTDIDIYVVGYTKAGVTFKTNADDMSLATDDQWVAMDCSTEAPSAIGLIFEIISTLTYQFGLRKNGSSDDRHVDTDDHNCFGAIIGCDASQICEGYIENLDVDFFLVGYVTDGCTFNTNATDVSLGTTDQWLDLSALPSGANMGFIEVTTNVKEYGLRKNGSAEDIYGDAFHHPWAIVECASLIIEGKIEGTTADFFVVGYSELAPLVISPSGIASAEAFGSHKANLHLAASGIATLEAFGSPQANLHLAPSGIATAEAIGSPITTGPLIASGIASLEAFGTAKLILFLLPSGIASAEAIGSHTVLPTTIVYPDAITSLEAFGSPVVAGPIIAVAIASEETFGSPQLNFVLFPSGITSEEAIGTLKVNLKILAQAIASAEALGTPVIAGPIIASGIASLEAVGTPQLNFIVYPSGVVSAEAFGTTQLNLRIEPIAITSEEAFGTLKVNFILLPSGIATLEALGTAIVAGPIIASGIPTAEVFGEPQLNLWVFPIGVVSEEAFGTTTVTIVIVPQPGVPYIVELHNSAGELVAILEDAHMVSLTRTINEASILTFSIPGDDTKISGISRSHEIWIRDYETGTVLEKFLLYFERNIRQ